MSKEVEAYEKSIAKFDDLIGGLQACMWTGDSEKARELAKQLTGYEHCWYCKGFRITLLPVQQTGICDLCPLHKYGESIAGKPVSYNGCYRIPDYRQMVRAASWLEESGSVTSIVDLVRKIEAVKEHLIRIKEIVIRENVTY